MRHRGGWSVLGLVVSGGLLGCTVVVPAPAPPHRPQGPPASVPKGAVNGKPNAMAPGGGLGIRIWREADGKWHVRSTTRGKKHVFRGVVFGAPGPVTWYEPKLMELGDSMAPHGRGLVFKFDTIGHIDGFDFVPDRHGCVRFHITVDEGPQPQQIFLGGAGSHPPSNHFVACP